MQERIRRRNLPHWDVPGAAYFVTSCLAGSIPARGLLDLAAYRAELQTRPCPDGMTKEDWGLHQAKLAFARLDRWLDEEPAVRWLENAELAAMSVATFYHFASERYDLLGFVVMPSHIHWVFRPLESWTRTLPVAGRSPRERIVHGFNLHTAREANRMLGRKSAFWQHEGYDHWVRDTDELERILNYVDNNPVKAGLVKHPHEWLYSSAYHRKLKGLPLGDPLR